jgi:TolB protein
VIGRLASSLSVVSVLLLLLAGGAGADVPAGPRLTFEGSGEGSFDLVSADPLGSDQRLLAGGAEMTASEITWSPDGSQFAFAGVTEVVKEGQLDIYLANADGSGATPLPGTRDGLNPVLSPDGSELAFTRMLRHEPRNPHHRKARGFVAMSTWLLDLRTGAVRQLTPWRNEVFWKPSSFSPDGSTLALTWEKGFEARPLPAAIAVKVDGKGSTVLARRARDPVYSPDGTRLALAVYGKAERGSKRRPSSELAVAAADGSGLRKLTSTPGYEGEPAWDPSGQRLAYTLFRLGPASKSIYDISSALMEINPDGSCETTVLFDPKVFITGPQWQPGPGRGAAPISC